MKNSSKMLFLVLVTSFMLGSFVDAAKKPKQQQAPKTSGGCASCGKR